jgi:flagellar protein FliO/FliZ
MAFGDYFQFVFALAFVLALILAAAWAFRRFGRGTVLTPRRAGPYRRRLGIVEAIALDTRRKLVLVRRDDREHLLIIGAQGETVVETGIVVPSDDDAEAAPGRRERPVPRPGTPSQDGGGAFLRLVRQSVRGQ